MRFIPANLLPFRSSNQTFLALIAATIALLIPVGPSLAQTWNLPGNGSWNSAANWNPATIPNAVGASVTFNSAASGSNPAQTGSSSIALDASQTIGSITFNNDAANSFTYSLATESK